MTMSIRTLALASALIACLVSFAHADEDAAPGKAPPGEVQLSPDQQKLIELRTEPVRLGILSNDLTVTGEVTPDEDRTTEITARTDGVLRQVDGKLGDRVEAGATLAVLESGGAAEAVAAYSAAQSRATLAQGQAAREEGLWRKGISSRRDYEVARQASSEAAAMLLAARRRMEFLGAFPDAKPAGTGKSSPALLAVRAPFRGTLIARHATVGDQVDANRTLFRLADLDQVWVMSNVFEADVGRLAIGQAAGISLLAYPDRTFPGHVAWISDVLDPTTRTVQVRVVAENKDAVLKPGSFANVTLQPSSQDKQLLLPSEAVQRQDNQSVAFVSLGSGRYRLTPIKVVARTETEAAVTGDLKAGEQVVTSGAFSLLSELEKSSFAGDE